MGKKFNVITPDLSAWIAAQKMFFVSTAPLAATGHVNCSPKGGDAFRILSPTEVVYQDYTGSGVETVAHLQENGRIVVMFCAFDGPPKIARLHGHGQVIAPDSPRHAEMSGLFPAHPGTRCFIFISVTRVADSCGYGVPHYDYRGQRDILDKWAAAKTPEQLRVFRHQHGERSIDGLPGLDESVQLK